MIANEPNGPHVRTAKNVNGLTTAVTMEENIISERNRFFADAKPRIRRKALGANAVSTTARGKAVNKSQSNGDIPKGNSSKYNRAVANATTNPRSN